MQDKECIRVGEKIKRKYLAQLRRDLDFLIEMNVMDYSLLVGVHRLNMEATRKRGASHRRQQSLTKPKRIKAGNMFTFEFGGMCAEKIMFASPKGNGKGKGKRKEANTKNIYFTGIIDFLQNYNAKKKLESMYKSVKVAGGKEAISAVDAKSYGERLFEFIAKRIE